MSDNVNVTPGSGATVAADSVGGVLYQRVKLSFGADGSASDVTTLNGMPVEVVAGGVSLSGEDHIGETGFSTAIITPTMTMDTTPDYSIGDVFGDKTTLTDAMRVANGGGLLTGITVIDRDNISPSFDILLFDSDPSNTTWTDNSAPTINTADAAKLIARLPIPGSFTGGAWTTVGSWKIGTAPLSYAVKASGATAHLYAVLIAQATINVATATNLVLRFAFTRY